MLALVRKGKTLKEIGKLYSITRERVRQICVCPEYADAVAEGKKVRPFKTKKFVDKVCIHCGKKFTRYYYPSQPEIRFCSRVCHFSHPKPKATLEERKAHHAAHMHAYYLRIKADAEKYAHRLRMSRKHVTAYWERKKADPVFMAEYKRKLAEKWAEIKADPVKHEEWKANSRMRSREKYKKRVLENWGDFYGFLRDHPELSTGGARQIGS